MIGQLLGPVAGSASSWLGCKDYKASCRSKIKTYRGRGKSKDTCYQKRLALLIGNVLWQKTAVRAGKTNFS